MCAPALRAFLKPLSKVVYYPDTFFPCCTTYMLSDGFFEFCNCMCIVLVYMVLKTPKDSSPVGLNPMNAVTILERDIC